MWVFLEAVDPCWQFVLLINAENASAVHGRYLIMNWKRRMVPCVQFTIRSETFLHQTFIETEQLMWNHVLYSWYHFVALPRLQGSNSCELNSWGDPVQPCSTEPPPHSHIPNSPVGSRINQDPLEPLELWQGQCSPCLAAEVSLGPWLWHGAGAAAFGEHQGSVCRGWAVLISVVSNSSTAF